MLYAKHLPCVLFMFHFFPHLSRSDSIDRPPLSVVIRRPHSLNIVSETTVPTEAKFHMKPSKDGKTKVCIIGPGHIIKMAAMRICGKNLKNYFFSRTTKPIALKLGMCLLELQHYKVCTLG